MMRFACPTCHFHLSAPEECAGRVSRCRQCGGAVTVPPASAPLPIAGLLVAALMLLFLMAGAGTFALISALKAAPSVAAKPAGELPRAAGNHKDEPELRIPEQRIPKPIEPAKGKLVDSSKAPVKSNGVPTVYGSEQMMMLGNQVGAPGLPAPPDKVLEYYKDIRKHRFYDGDSWKFREPTRDEQLAVTRFWARQPEASVFDELADWHLACVSGIKDEGDEVGEQRAFQVTIRPKNRSYLFLMNPKGTVCIALDLGR
jgi:hypothetical protein